MIYGPLESRTILVTGGTGFIGSRLVARLRSMPGVRLIVLSRRGGPLTTQGEVEAIATPLEEVSAETWSAAHVKRIDLVFHLGGFIPKDPAQADAVADVFAGNLEGTRRLLEALPGTVQGIVFSSTVDVYRPPAQGEVLSEDSALGPRTLYGASKLFCEHLIEVHARENGWDCMIVRYGHIYGPGEEAYAKLIPQTIRQLRRSESPTVYGDGSAERDYLYVDDAVEATIRAATVSAAKASVVNVVRGQSVPVSQVVEQLAEIVEPGQKVRYLADKPAGHSLRFDNTRMRSLLGEWEFVSFADGLRLEAEQFRDWPVNGAVSGGGAAAHQGDGPLPR